MHSLKKTLNIIPEFGGWLLVTTFRAVGKDHDLDAADQYIHQPANIGRGR